MATQKVYLQGHYEIPDHGIEIPFHSTEVVIAHPPLVEQIDAGVEEISTVRFVQRQPGSPVYDWDRQDRLPGL